MPVIDASVYVALVRADDPHHDPARRWFEAALRRGDVLRAPEILPPEVAAAVRRHTGSRSLARSVAESLRRQGLVRLDPIGPDLADRAAAIASEHGLRGCDALYVALAALTEDRLITLDREQLSRGSGAAPTESPLDEG